MGLKEKYNSKNIRNHLLANQEKLKCFSQRRVESKFTQKILLFGLKNVSRCKVNSFNIININQQCIYTTEQPLSCSLVLGTEELCTSAQPERTRENANIPEAKHPKSYTKATQSRAVPCIVKSRQQFLVFPTALQSRTFTLSVRMRTGKSISPRLRLFSFPYVCV